MFRGKEYGTVVKEITQDIWSLFEPVEGINTVYYGKVRNGKTYAATADILELLERGEVVYANWPINFQDYDERKSFGVALVKWFFGRKFFYKFNSSNFHYFHPDDIDISFLGKLVGVHLFIDEGQWIFNSQIREQDPEKRKLILHGGHYCRTLNVITQRPTNIFKDIRSQINIWYKCEKRLHIGKLILFQRWSFEDVTGDDCLPDEEKPTGRPKTYFASKKIFNAYNTHAMRAKDAIVDVPKFEVFELSRWQRFKLLLSYFLPRIGAFRRRARNKDVTMPEAPVKIPEHSIRQIQRSERVLPKTIDDMHISNILDLRRRDMT